MKKIICAVLLLTISIHVDAKKIKFACDMTGIPINPTGIHIVSDFQTIAGFPGGDWNSATTPLTQEGTSSIYSIILDLPAFAKYEYKYCNGDQSYEVEFVPEASRVGYNFVDNRWIYLDSLADDTTFIGALQWNQNSPAGLTLVRFYVDMQNEVAASSGVHLAGDFQGWDPAATILYSFGANIYEVISYVDTGIYQYKFYNGNNASVIETTPTPCAVNGNRQIAVQYDTLLTNVCYSSCVACVSTAGLANHTTTIDLQIAPNPATKNTTLEWNDYSNYHNITLRDITGRIVREYKNADGNMLMIEKENLGSGIYFATIAAVNTGSSKSIKFIFE